jgi:hypothetical protein
LTHASRTDKQGEDALKGVEEVKASEALAGVGALALVSGGRVSNT